MTSSDSSGDASSRPAPVLLLIGPTASGKTDVGVELALRLDAEIVAADARQLYRGLDLGTGKPDARARRAVAHHLLDCLDPTERANAASYGRRAREAIAAIQRRGRRAIVVGGSGLYVRALVEGIFDGPGRNDAIRDALARRAASSGWPALHAELSKRDPAAADRIHPNDSVRITRALEIIDATGLSVGEARRSLSLAPLDSPTRSFAIDWPREELRRRIAERFEAMLSAGLVSEVQGLLERGVPRDAPAFDSPGYREIVAHLACEMSLEEAAELAVQSTRQYAKRQLTWFRKWPDLEWVRAATDPALVAADIVSRL